MKVKKRSQTLISFHISQRKANLLAFMISFIKKSSYELPFPNCLKNLELLKKLPSDVNNLSLHIQLNLIIYDEKTLTSVSVLHRLPRHPTSRTLDAACHANSRPHVACSGRRQLCQLISRPELHPVFVRP